MIATILLVIVAIRYSARRDAWSGIATHDVVLQPFPVNLGDSINDARKKLGDPQADVVENFEHLDRFIFTPANPENWRHALYSEMVEVNEGGVLTANLDFHLIYRKDTGQIWGISITGRADECRYQLLGISSRRSLKDCIAMLGKFNRRAAGERPYTFDTYYWIKDGIGVQVRVYNRDYSDMIAGDHPEGQVDSVYVVSLSLAPPGFAGYFGGDQDETK